jgi:hypothetical protein
VKVVSERLGHATPAFTIDTYQHVLPGMQAAAAGTFEALLAPSLPPTVGSREKTRLKRGGNTGPATVEAWPILRSTRASWWRGQDLNLRPSGYEWSVSVLLTAHFDGLVVCPRSWP